MLLLQDGHNAIMTQFANNISPESCLSSTEVDISMLQDPVDTLVHQV